MFVPRSDAIWVIDTFMTELSSTITNWAAARMAIAVQFTPTLYGSSSGRSTLGASFGHEIPRKDHERPQAHRHNHHHVHHDDRRRLALEAHARAVPSPPPEGHRASLHRRALGRAPARHVPLRRLRL